jgi:hypothetical protein
MYESKNKLGVFILVMVFLVLCLPLTGAENVTGGDTLTNPTPTPTASSGAPFITIDPVGNHSIGDVFFINGTTNLPVSENLTMDIAFYPPCFSREYTFCEAAPIKDFPISPASSGTNRWSVNVTDSFKNLPYGQYLIDVSEPVHFPCNTTGCGIPKAVAESLITLSQTNNSTALNVPQTTIPSPSPIQPTTSAVTVLPTTRFSPLPIALPIEILAAIVILRPLYRKKRD